MMWRVMTRASRTTGAVVVAWMLMAGIAGAQQPIAFSGTVQWTSSTRVQVWADSGVSVAVDVGGIDQTVYTSLRVGDRIRISGYVTRDRSRVIAESIVPDVWSLPQTS
jgi:hypothetical protein